MSATQQLLRYVTPKEARLTVEEIHEGVCADHLAGKALVLKILRQGYFWPTLSKDAMDYVQKYHQRQIHANVPRKHPTELTPIMCPVPFSMWG